MAFGKKRVGACGDFLREGLAVAIGIARRTDARRAIPVEFIAISNAIANLFKMMSIVSSPDTVSYFDEKWNACTLRYGDMKKQLAEDMVAVLNPIRERIQEYSSNTDLLDRIAAAGAMKARESAVKTLKEVRKTIGFRVY